MSIPVEQSAADWYRDNNFTEESVVLAAFSIISTKHDQSSGGSLIGRDRGNLQRRFSGALPGMLGARGMSILEERGLSIYEMMKEGLLNDDVLVNLRPSIRYDYINHQGSSLVEFVYYQGYPMVPGSCGLTLREQRKVAENHCRLIMDGNVGIFPGIHNLRDTLAFFSAYRRVHGEYPIIEGEAFRTSDLLWVTEQDEYHPSVWLYREGLAVEVTGADNTISGVKVPFFWAPS